jgi:hypothetical protein
LWHGNAGEMNEENALATISNFNGHASAYFENFNLTV